MTKRKPLKEPAHEGGSNNHFGIGEYVIGVHLDHGAEYHDMRSHREPGEIVLPPAVKMRADFAAAVKQLFLRKDPR